MVAIDKGTLDRLAKRFADIFNMDYYKETRLVFMIEGYVLMGGGSYQRVISHEFIHAEMKRMKE